MVSDRLSPMRLTADLASGDYLHRRVRVSGVSGRVKQIACKLVAGAVKGAVQQDVWCVLAESYSFTQSVSQLYAAIVLTLFYVITELNSTTSTLIEN